jgi:hypothetical protein
MVDGSIFRPVYSIYLNKWVVERKNLFSTQVLIARYELRRFEEKKLFLQHKRLYQIATWPYEQVNIAQGGRYLRDIFTNYSFMQLWKIFFCFPRVVEFFLVVI